ncbi:MAG: hypothetical protein LBE02_04915 [Spirochaetaceae bacterium]|jgi:hypothetical protein|nr:hypothetical protein [Spirochaetaceae bacterium]
MKTPEPVFNFLILAPHRDCKPPLQEYRRSLFAAGLAGAHSFPLAAPLALLDRPLSPFELREAAAGLRRTLGRNKIMLAPPKRARICGCPGTGIFRFFGPALDLPSVSFLPVSAPEEKPPLAPALLGPEDEALIRALAEAGTLPAPPELSFRAAALANLSFFPAGCGEEHYSFTWRIERLYWLPRPQKPGNRFLAGNGPLSGEGGKEP